MSKCIMVVGWAFAALFVSEVSAVDGAARAVLLSDMTMQKCQPYKLRCSAEPEAEGMLECWSDFMGEHICGHPQDWPRPASSSAIGYTPGRRFRDDGEVWMAARCVRF